jgi:DNA polymerase III epsilon subunit-like protein
MSDIVVCIGEGPLPSGEHYRVVGPLNITADMGPTKPMSPERLEKFCASMRERGAHLIWDGDAFNIHWQAFRNEKGAPMRDPMAWVDFDGVLVNFSDLMKRWKLKHKPAVNSDLSTPIHLIPQAYVDIETNGLSDKFHKIIEISICRINPGEAPQWYTTFVKPGGKVKLSDDTKRLTGITDADLQSAPRFKDIAPRVFDMLSNCVVISHTTNNFDERFITKELETCEYQWKPASRLNTIKLAQEFYDQLPNYKLKTIATELKLPVPTHRAETDVKAMMALWDLMMLRATERTPAVVTLGQFMSL